MAGIHRDILGCFLGMALSKSIPNGVNVKWVDDAFFGYVCSAKDVYGQFTGVITAAIGAGLIYSDQKSR